MWTARDSCKITGMWRAALALLVTAAAATPQEPSLAAIGEWTDALSWTSSLRDPMRRMTNPVVTAYGIASLAAVTCPFDQPLGADMFHEALADLNGLPSRSFHDPKGKVLPVATFSGLWKLVMGPGLKCDPNMPQPNDSARARRESERSEAGPYLKEAKEDLAQPKSGVDYDRAAQLARAAIEAGDPSELDIAALTDFLVQLGGPAPDLADDLFLRAIGFVLEAPVPNREDLACLGDYLFEAPPPSGESASPHPNSTPGAAFSAWQQEPGGNPDLLPPYVGAWAGLIANPLTASADREAEINAAMRLLPISRELGLADARVLETFLGQSPAGSPGVDPAAQAGIAPVPSIVPTPAQFVHFTTQVRLAMSAGRFAQARDALSEIDGVTVRSLIGSVIDFSEYAYPLQGKDADRAFALAGKLPAGVKRALLYAGVVAASSNRLTAIFALHLGLKDVELLSYEQRMAVLAALATAASGVDRDETQAVLSSIITSANGANTSPRKLQFDAKYPFSFDGPRVLRDREGFQELIEGDQGRATFPLRVPGVRAFSLEDFILQAKDVDFMRLVATVEGLHNELQLTRAYVALARLRLKMAKARTTKGG